VPILVSLIILSFIPASAGASSSVPSAPLYAAGDIVGDTLNVYWQAPTDDGGSPITSYFVSETETNPVSLCSTVATMTNCAFQPSLTTPSPLYVFAVNASGDSAPAVASIPPIPDGEDTSLTTVSGHGEITVNWIPLYTSPGVSISYQVVMSSNDLTYNGRKCTTNSLKCVFTGLLSKDKYAFIFQGMDDHGGFTLPDVTPLVSPLAGSTTPPSRKLLAPILSAPIQGPRVVTLHWRRSEASLVPTSYYVYYGTSSSLGLMNRILVSASRSPAATYRINGLSRSKRYYFVVEARLGGKISPVSNKVSSFG
jgi:hypothetical protein